MKAVEKDIVESQYNYWRDKHEQAGNAFTRGAADAWARWREDLGYIDWE